MGTESRIPPMELSVRKGQRVIIEEEIRVWISFFIFFRFLRCDGGRKGRGRGRGRDERLYCSIELSVFLILDVGIGGSMRIGVGVGWMDGSGVHKSGCWRSWSWCGQHLEAEWMVSRKTTFC